MAVNSGIFSDPNAVIARAMRAMGQRATPDRDALYRDYSADRDVYNRVWRPTPYELREAEVERVAQDLGIDTDTARSLIREAARIEGGGIDIMEHMQPNLQYANFIGLLQNHRENLAPFVRTALTPLEREAPRNVPAPVAPSLVAPPREVMRKAAEEERQEETQRSIARRAEEQMAMPAMRAEAARMQEIEESQSALRAEMEAQAVMAEENARMAAAEESEAAALAAMEDKARLDAMFTQERSLLDRAPVAPVAPAAPEPSRSLRAPVDLEAEAAAAARALQADIDFAKQEQEGMEAEEANARMAAIEESQAAALAAQEIAEAMTQNEMGMGMRSGPTPGSFRAAEEEALGFTVPAPVEAVRSLEGPPGPTPARGAPAGLANLNDVQNVEEAAIPSPISLGRLAEAIAAQASLAMDDIAPSYQNEMETAAEAAQAQAARDIAAAMAQNEMGMAQRDLANYNEAPQTITPPAPVAAVRAYQEPNMPAPVSPEAVARAVAEAQRAEVAALTAAMAENERGIPGVEEAAIPGPISLGQLTEAIALAEREAEMAAQLAQDLQSVEEASIPGPDMAAAQRAAEAEAAREAARQGAAAELAEEQAAQLAQDLQGIPGIGLQNEAPTAGFGYGSQNEAPTAGFGYGSQNEAPAPANFGNLPAEDEAARQNEMESLNEAQQPAEFGVPGPGLGLGSLFNPVAELEQALAEARANEPVGVVGPAAEITAAQDFGFNPATIRGFTPEQRLEQVAADLASNVTSRRTAPIQGIVMHETAGVSNIPGGVVGWSNKSKTGAHYYVDLEGNVRQMLPDNRTIGHTGKGRGRAGDANPSLDNHNSIGIEIQTIPGTKPNAKQVEAAAGLARYLAAKYGLNVARDVYGHGELAIGHRPAIEGMTAVNALRGLPTTDDRPPVKEGSRGVVGPDGKPAGSPARPVNRRGVTEGMGKQPQRQQRSSLDDLPGIRALGRALAGMNPLSVSTAQAAQPPSQAEQFAPTPPAVPALFATPTPAGTVPVATVPAMTSSFGDLNERSSSFSPEPASQGAPSAASASSAPSSQSASAAAAQSQPSPSSAGPSVSARSGQGSAQPQQSLEVGIVSAQDLSPRATFTGTRGQEDIVTRENYTTLPALVFTEDDVVDEGAKMGVRSEAASMRAGPTPGSFRGAQEVGMQGSFRSAQEVGMQALESGLAALSSSFAAQPSTGSYGVQSEDTTEADPDGGMPGGQTAAQAMAEQAATLGSLGNEQDGPGTTDPSTGSTTGETSPGGGDGTETANYGEMGFGVFGGDGGQSNDTSGTGGGSGTGTGGGTGGYGGSTDGQTGGGYSEGSGPGGPADSGMGSSGPSDGASTSGGPMADGGRVSAPKQYKAIVERALRAARRSRAA